VVLELRLRRSLRRSGSGSGAEMEDPEAAVSIHALDDEVSAMRDRDRIG
jgi:hypothetical protein